jgi:phosphohistidine phosphatase
MSAVLYLMRHGVAEDAGPGMSDAERALTADGIRKTKRVALGLKTLDIKFDLIVSSPLRRAEETAHLVAEIVAPGAPLELRASLAGGTPDEVVKGLRPYRDCGQILLVGHQPDLGELASHLLTGSTTLAPLPFKKAGVAAIAVDALPPRSAGVLEWFLTAGQLRAIGGSRGDA